MHVSISEIFPPINKTEKCISFPIVPERKKEWIQNILLLILLDPIFHIPHASFRKNRIAS